VPRRKALLFASSLVAAGIVLGAAAVGAMVWPWKPRTLVVLEATLADGSKETASFPVRKLRFPAFAQPVPQPAGARRTVATIRISTASERRVPFFGWKRDRIDVGIRVVGNRSWTDYEVLAADGGPFIRRVHPPPPLPGVPEKQVNDWCGIPEGMRPGVVRPRDDATIAREAMALLASLCDRPDLPFQVDDDVNLEEAIAPLEQDLLKGTTKSR